MMRGGKVRKSEIVRDIQGLIRTFPSTSVTILRAKETPVQGPLREPNPLYQEDVVFKGEAMVKPISGQVQRYGLGQVTNVTNTILIAGIRDIRMADFVIIDGARYQVTDSTPYENAYMLLNITKMSQARQP